MLGTSSARTMHGESRCAEQTRKKARPDESFRTPPIPIEDIGSRSNRGALDSTFLFLHLVFPTRSRKTVARSLDPIVNIATYGSGWNINFNPVRQRRERGLIFIYDPVGTVNRFDFELFSVAGKQQSLFYCDRIVAYRSMVESSDKMTILPRRGTARANCWQWEPISAFPQRTSPVDSSPIVIVLWMERPIM